MKTTQIDRDAFAAIPPLALRAYLAAEGWRAGESFGDIGEIYRREGGPELVAPTRADVSDYGLAIERIVDVLSSFEQRPPRAILRDLTVADVDLIRVRAPRAEDDGSILIKDGVALIERSRELLLAAACAASKPKRAYRAGKVKEANDYLEDVRLGQTERGSFVVTLLSPVPPSLQDVQTPMLWPTMDAEPFSRRVTRRLAESLRAAREAIDDVSRGQLIEAFEKRVEVGVSANLCSAAADLIQRGRGLEVSVRWSLARLAPMKSEVVRFQESDAAVLSEAGRVLREREPREGERLEGYVTRLARSPNATEGDVTLQAPVDDVMVAVRVNLEPQDYSIMTRAHEQRIPVAIEGDLERDGQRWRLTRPRSIELLAADDASSDLPPAGGGGADPM